MTLNESTQLLSKEASLKLMEDMLRQAEEDKRELLDALREIQRNCEPFAKAHNMAGRLQAIARAAIDKVEGNY